MTVILTSVTLCGKCSYNLGQIQKRFGSSLYRKVRDHEEKKNVVHQYAGKNIERAKRVYGWGLAETGALGVKTLVQPQKNQKYRPVQLNPLKIDFFPHYNFKIKTLECGNGFSVFLCENKLGKEVLMGSGINVDSQIGYHEFPRRSGRVLETLIEPAVINLPITDPEKTCITHIACGRAHTVVVTDNEGIFTLGSNSFGQCGRKIIEDEIYKGSMNINRIEFGEKVKQVVCGLDHTLVLTEDGQVFSCGLGRDGQTGQGHYGCIDSFTLVGGDIKGEKIVQISSRADTALAVSEKGDIFGWGNTEYDQLEFIVPGESQLHTPRNLPFKTGKVKLAAAAGSMCALVNDEDRVFTWGYGLLGRGPKVHQCFIPEPIPATLFGLNEYNGKSGIKDIQCGLHYFAVITKTGSLYTWGKNRTASLGLGHVLDMSYPYMAHIPAEVDKVCCGVDHAFVIGKAFV